ncbi:MAG TPA: hypothetical protein VFK38_02780 [Candidatus Limnocylindrales bacterium]|nr:hypothetical protein [Candidatus Limnocylindrales bacterium]
MTRPDIESAVRIAWTAEGYETITVLAPRRSREELDNFARGVADEALLNRSLHGLRSALRQRFDGTFEFDHRRRDGEGRPIVLVKLHPPRGQPNPDPDL